MLKQNDRIRIINTILEIEKILKRRTRYDKLSSYNQGRKKHKKQLEFHRSSKRNRWVFGGNRSGKTECGAVEAVWWARGIHPYRKNRKEVNGWVVSPSYEVQREVAQAKILSYLSPDYIIDVVMLSGRKGAPEYGVIDYLVVKNELGGVSKIAFKSADQGREKFQGASLDFVWFDEEPARDIYEECLMRVLDRKGDIWGTMTPLKGRTYIYDEIYLNARNNQQIWCITMEWEDNPYLDKGEIAALSQSLASETLDSRRYGRFSVDGGLVYSEFQPDLHIIAPFDVPLEWYDTISIDPGLHNPLSCHFYAVDYDGTIYVIAEHYEKEKDIEHHSAEIKRIADRLNWHRRSGRLEALIDSAASQRTLSSLRSVAELFYEKDILTNTKVNKDLWSGIARVKSLFAARPARIFIFSNCINLIRELKGYSWGEGDAPKKENDHALDELRYYVMSRPEPAERREMVTEISRDKNKLIKQAVRNMKRIND
ncbi:MAG: hypothetical protein EOM87_05030 [Clostridia bacterium]|nr:hypothetical protein [Clostridia bacterium]